MEVLTILVVGLAVLSAAMTNAIVQRRLLAAGNGWLRSTVVSGFTGFGVALGLIGGCMLVGHLIWRMMR